MLKIAVEHNDDIPVGMIDAGYQRHLVAKAPRHRQNCDARVASTDRQEDVLSSVRKWVHNIDDIDDVFVGKSVKRFRESSMKGGDNLLFAINRANDVQSSHEAALYLTVFCNPANSFVCGCQPTA